MTPPRLPHFSTGVLEAWCILVVMKKILNDPQNFVPEMLDGLLKAHPDQLTYTEELHAIVRADAPVPGKVGLATGGGSGHLPVFLGYVGTL